MDNQVFDTYFKKTIWKAGRDIPSDAELSKMEDECIEKLMELSQADKQQYNYTYSYYSDYIDKRIRFFKYNSKNNDNSDIKTLLFSAERLRKKLTAVDRIHSKDDDVRKLIRAVNKYADAIVWHSTDKRLSFEELNRLETDTVSALLKLKELDYLRFRITYTDFGKRMSRKIALIQNEEPKNASNYLLSLKRILSNLKGMDKDLFLSELSLYISHNKKIIEGTQKAEEAPKTEKRHEKQISEVPHFKSLKIKDKDASHLYEILVNEGYLEDTGSEDFVYYFTGKGKKATNKLIWREEAIVLSILMSELCGNRIQWKVMDKVFEGLNTDSMKSNYAKTVNSNNPNNKSYVKPNLQYQEHLELVEGWLKKVNI